MHAANNNRPLCARWSQELLNQRKSESAASNEKSAVCGSDLTHKGDTPANIVCRDRPPLFTTNGVDGDMTESLLGASGTRPVGVDDRWSPFSCTMNNMLDVLIRNQLRPQRQQWLGPETRKTLNFGLRVL